MENSAPNHGGTFSHKNECSFRLSGHASPAQRKPDSNSSRRSPVAALQKLGRNCSIYPRFISMLQEDFRLANKFPEVSTLAGPLRALCITFFFLAEQSNEVKMAESRCLF